MLLSFIEIGNHAYVTIFPFEQHPAAQFEKETDVGSSEAVTHLSNKDFILIRQEIKGRKQMVSNIRGHTKSVLIGPHRGTVDVGRLRGFGDAEGMRLL